jgi:hypothetical protein
MAARTRKEEVAHALYKCSKNLFGATPDSFAFRLDTISPPIYLSFRVSP